jgi:predicted nucleotide-binding protein (sugar kinase/HSP70/actin superfamily)
MNEKQKRIVSFPRMGNIHIPICKLFEKMGAEIILPPENNKTTLNLGTRHSVESVCLPYKLNLGNYIQALEAGANTLIMFQAPGSCRLGRYVENQEMKLRELGYNFDMVIFDLYKGKFCEVIKKFSYACGRNINFINGAKAVLYSLELFDMIDQFEEMLFYYRPREENKGESEKLYKKALKLVQNACSSKEIIDIKIYVTDEFKKISVNKSKEIVKIFITGEFFILLDPFSNMEIEKELAGMNVEVERQVMLSHWTNGILMPKWLYKHESHKERAIRTAKKYMTRVVGGDCIESIGDTVYASKHNIDGVIHLGPFGCIPEIVSQCVLPYVSKQENIPVISLNIDEHTGRAGLITRLEAFVDLLKRRRQCRSERFQFIQ